MVHYEGLRRRTGPLDSARVSNEWKEPVSEQKAPSYTERKNSGLGIASFVTSITAGILLFVTAIIAGVMTASGTDPGSTEGIMVGSALIGLNIAEFVALGLGIGGLFQKEKKKRLAILGTVFSSLAIVVMVLFMIFSG